MTRSDEVVPADLDATIHAPKRLTALALLAGLEEAEFAFLQRRMNLSASDLSKQMSTLVEAGHVAVRKTGRGRGSGTWFQLTDHGRTEFENYKAALRALLSE